MTYKALLFFPLIFGSQILQAQTRTSSRPIILPFHRLAGEPDLPIIQLYVNGNQPRRFLFCSSLTASVVLDRSFPRGPVNISVAPNNPLRIESATRQDLAGLHKSHGLMDVAGLIGPSAFRDFVVSLDFRRRTLTLLHPDAKENAGWKEWKTQSGPPSVQLQLGKISKHHATIDTTLLTSTIPGDLSAELVPARRSYGLRREGLPALQQVTLSNLHTDTKPLPASEFESGKEAVLGLSFLKDFILVLDVQNHRFLLETSSGKGNGPQKLSTTDSNDAVSALDQKRWQEYVRQLQSNISAATRQTRKRGVGIDDGTNPHTLRNSPHYDPYRYGRIPIF